MAPTAQSEPLAVYDVQSLAGLPRDAGLAEALNSGPSAALIGDCAGEPVDGAESLNSGLVRVIAGTSFAIVESNTTHVATKPFGRSTKRLLEVRCRSEAGGRFSERKVIVLHFMHGSPLCACREEQSRDHMTTLMAIEGNE